MMDREVHEPRGASPATPFRPIGFWLKLLDRLIEEDLTRTLLEFGLTRQHWQALNIVTNDPQNADEIARQLRPFLNHDNDADTLLSELIAAGWIRHGDGEELELGDIGHRRIDVIREAVASARKRVAAGLTQQDYGTTIASLATMSKNLGWQEGD